MIEKLEASDWRSPKNRRDDPRFEQAKSTYLALVEALSKGGPELDQAITVAQAVYRFYSPHAYLDSYRIVNESFSGIDLRYLADASVLSEMDRNSGKAVSLLELIDLIASVRSFIAQQRT